MSKRNPKTVISVEGDRGKSLAHYGAHLGAQATAGRARTFDRNTKAARNKRAARGKVRKERWG